jgi:hypothetical protein
VQDGKCGSEEPDGVLHVASVGAKRKKTGKLQPWEFSVNQCWTRASELVWCNPASGLGPNEE